MVSSRSGDRPIRWIQDTAFEVLDKNRSVAAGRYRSRLDTERVTDSCDGAGGRQEINIVACNGNGDRSSPDTVGECPGLGRPNWDVFQARESDVRPVIIRRRRWIVRPVKR